MDGVVIDSEKLHLKAMGLTLEKYGIDYSPLFLNEYVGRSDESFFRYVYENMDNTYAVEELVSVKNVFFEDLLKELQHIEGFSDFIRRVKKMKIQTGLVTTSSLFTVRKVDSLLNFVSFFDVVITEEDSLKHKPNPEPYLLALEKLKADKSSTLIFEDSINGILAGKAAGCKVVGLTTSFDSQTLQKVGADYVISNFSEFNIKHEL